MNSPIIDFRSDNLAKSPQAMLQTISQAPVKNNQSLDDVEAISFENRLANLFGKEASLVFPTVSMANIALVMAQTNPGSQVIISSYSLEKTGCSFSLLAGVQTRQIITKSGTFTAQQVKQKIRKQKQHVTFPNTDLIFVQNATFVGRVWDLVQLRQVKKVAEQNNVKLHLDGARIWNAFATYQIQPKQISDTYDSITVCFTKGLNCPIGAAVIGTKQLINRLKNIRKGLGGGLWHYGLITSAVDYALKYQLPGIKKDNYIAKLLAQGLAKIQQIQIEPIEVDINMIFWRPKSQKFDHAHFQEYMKLNRIRIRTVDLDTGRYRLVIHRDIRQPQIQATLKIIKNYIQITQN